MDEEYWNKKFREHNYPWMSDDQIECFNMLCDIFGGSHHIEGKIKAAARGIEINMIDCNWSTFDSNILTRAVVMAHDKLIRFQISSSRPGMLRLYLHKKKKRIGRSNEIHPTIEDAIVAIRSV